MTTESARLSGLLFLISLAGSIGLVAMGIIFILDNDAAAQLFGLPLHGGGDGIYVTVAAVRDLSVGALAVAFALLRDRRAMGLTVLFGAIIPIGDGIVVWLHSSTPWKFVPLHGAGAVGCLVFAYLLFRRGAGPNR